MTLEEQARALWVSWGHQYALYTRCSGCGEIVYCRGKKRSKMLCLDCFDSL